MCAILGWFNQKEKLLSKAEMFQKMLELMSYRGHDHTGYYQDDHLLLGHKRLAIIDLEKGDQPMYYKDYVIIYNGEIYNTEELRKELKGKGYQFETRSDTEVILKGYDCYKKKILNKLEGIFAFSIYDKKHQEFFLGRDQFGVKPLYYTFKDGNFIFSSSIKSILASEVVEPILDKKCLGEILALGPSKRTGSGIFKDIEELRPAHYLSFRKNKIKCKRYWQLVTRKCNDSLKEASDKVKQYLTASIKKQMISDVGIATLLSGGLDSSIITAVVAMNRNDKLDTYSIDYEDNDKYFQKNNFQVSLDEYYIDIMSKCFKTEHHYKIITQEDVVEYLKKTLYYRDYPGMMDIDSSLLWFSEEISKDHKVILSGECADEIFGGYPWFYRNDLNQRQSFPWINNIEYRESLLHSQIRKKISLSKVLKKEYTKTIRELKRKDRKDKYKRLFYINMTHFMTTLLDRKDRMTMGATIEARVPFADTKLVEYLWNLPFDYKYQDGIEKYLLRNAFKDIIPNEVLMRKKNP